MFVTEKGVSYLSKNVQSWENLDYQFFWKGLLFILGLQNGIESVKRFSVEIRNKGIEDAVHLLKGSFFMVVKDKKDNKYYCFIDNNGCLHVYYSDRAISTSLLDLIKVEGLSKLNLDKKAVVEFVHFGSIYSHRTFFDSIRKIDRRQILILSPDRKICETKKLLPEIDNQSEEISVFNFFKDFVNSIRNLKVSVDLTSGADSRLVASLLDYYGLEFETAISGINGNEEIEIAQKVANVLKHPIYVTYHSIDNLEDELIEIFKIGEGMFDILKYHRPLQNQKNRQKRGIDLVIMGFGGESFKDYWWLQDFPFYSKKKPNLNRLYNIRMAPIKLKHSYFSDDYMIYSKNVKEEVLRRLSLYILDTNTKTYDNIYYNYKMQEFGASHSTPNNKLLKCYSPLMEPEFFVYSFNLPRRERFFNFFHRKIITAINPDVAKIGTLESGLSLSSEFRYVIRDIYKDIINKGVRITKKLGEKVLHKTYLQENPNHPDFFSKVRKLSLSNNSIKLLKDEGIIRKELDLKDINNKYIGNLITLAMVLSYVMKKGFG